MAGPTRPEPPYRYSKDDFQNMSPDEAKRASAEFKSYIARIKRIDREASERKSEAGAEVAQVLSASSASSSYVPVAPSSPFRNSTGFGPQRGAYSRTSGHYSGFHPYQRTVPKFKNNSVVFKQEGLADGSLNDKTEAMPTIAFASSYARDQSDQQPEPTKLCPTFTWTGICSRRGCSHLHDPEKQSVCKHWLFKGECPKGDSCALSHSPSAHNAPNCQHFQEGRCNNENCRFAHVRVNPAAQNCYAFGLIGYCEDGAKCRELHAHECPRYSNKGSCPYGDNCRLGHVRRASRMRRAPSHSSESRFSPPESIKEEVDEQKDAKPHVGSVEAKAAQTHHKFTQQVDYVSLSD